MIVELDAQRLPFFFVFERQLYILELSNPSVKVCSDDQQEHSVLVKVIFITMEPRD